LKEKKYDKGKPGFGKDTGDPLSEAFRPFADVQDGIRKFKVAVPEPCIK